MKTCVIALMVLTAVGLGMAVLILGTDTFHTTKSYGESIANAILPGLIGTIALSGLTVTLAVDESKRDNAARLDRIVAALADDHAASP